MATFCLIHGDWHDGACWAQIVGRLEARGHTAVAPDLPFHDPEASYTDRVRPALDALEKVPGPVVAVGHSVGSGYAPLVAAERPGSVLVHLCPRLGPFPSPPGAPSTFRQGFPFPDRRPDTTMVWDEEAAIAAMYSRLPPETARETARRLHPAAPPAGEFPLPGHPEVPTVFVYAADDEIFDPEWERFMAREVIGVEPIEIPGGHFPMLEDPDGLTGLLDSIANR